MAFAWIPDAIPNLLIGLFLCGLAARVWRLRGSQVGRPLIAVASVLAAFTTLLSVGIMVSGFDSAVRATGLAMASGVLPLAAALALVSATFGLRRLGLLDEVRVERVGVIENLSDGVLLLDKQDQLVALNRAARRVLNLREVAPAEQPVVTLLVEYPSLSKLLSHSNAGRTELESCNERGEKSIYDVDVSLVMERGANAGRAIVLRDVTSSKRTEGELEREAKRVALLLDVESAVAAATTVESALAAGVETICRSMGWPLGHVYQPWEGDRPELCSASIDYTEEVGVYDALIEAIGASGFEPRCGTPGRAWWTHEVEQIDDLSSDPSHPRNAIASDLGLSAALAVPIPVDIDVVAVIEFLAPSMSDLDERTIEILKHLGGSLGRSIAQHRANLQIRGLEYFDGLTGLPNRELFRERLQARLEDEFARDQKMAVLFVDLDGFQQVNEALGYVAGDQVLREVSRRFHKLTRLTDVVSRGDLPDPANSSVSLSRLGGDEFLLLLNKLESPGDASHVAARLVAGLFEPIVVLEQEVMVGASVGIAIYPEDGQDAETLICAADEAMSTAKSQGGNAYRFYAETMNHLSTRQLHLEHRLREAASREDWTLHYQPVRNAPTGRVRAVEALLRWDYPDLGLVTPSEFLQVAEDIGLSSSIGDWVLREACFQAARWRDEGFAGIRIAVNVSPRQIREGDLVAGVISALENAGVSGDQLELEINESSILQDEERSRSVLEAIRELGVTVSLDRFGTGYSSITHLRDFPIDRLKVDRSLVSQMEADPSKAAIVRAIIGLARQLDIGVVAEGVENESELRLLRAEGCDDLQGYLFSKPLPADQITRFFEREKDEDSDTF